MSSLALPTIRHIKTRGHVSDHKTLSQELQTIEDVLEQETKELPGYGYYARLELEIQAVRGLGAIRPKNGGKEA